LGSALTALARQGQLQIFFESDQVQGLQGPALRGRYEPVEALRQLLRGSGLELVEAAGSFVVRRMPVSTTEANAIELGSVSIVGDGRQVDSASVGRSTLTRKEIERQQAENIPSLLQTLPGVSMGGSSKQGGQTVNIWGLGDAEDVPFSLDGASK
ncbi:STN domain-containing protein, partial [Bowmanella yangjiangensis]